MARVHTVAKNMLLTVRALRRDCGGKKTTHCISRVIVQRSRKKLDFFSWFFTQFMLGAAKIK